MSPANSTTIAFLDEGSRAPRSMTVTEALATAVVRAAAVNANREGFPVSFTSLFIGLLATPDPTGDWLRVQFERTHADLAGLLRRRDLTLDGLQQLLKSGPTASELREPFKRTVSARHALDEAERLARVASADATGTEDVLVAFLNLPGFHDEDFRAGGINRALWAASFLKAEIDRLNQPAVSNQAPPSSGTSLEFDPRAPGVERHVATALQHANALAGSDAIGARHVITAVVRLAESIGSAAFTRAAQLVPLPSDVALSSPGAVPDAARFEEDLRGQLARAQRPQAGSTERSPVWGRDLVTAALLCADDSVGPAVAAAGQPLDMVRDLWYSFVKADSHHRPAADWAAWWREADVPLPGPRRAGYATETDQGDDKLGVDAEAHAFARLILDKDVQAPLSIGLLGDWGSGKSFFIEQIKKGIADLKQEGRPELYARVVEIEFNAWHASDSNLWASLVTNIFDAIWDNVSPTDTKNLKEAREQLHKQIEQAHGAVHEAETQVQLGQQALETAEQDLQQKREVLAWNRYVTKVTADGLRKLAKAAGWHESIETINDVENAAQSLAASGNRLRMVVSALVEKPLLHIALPAAVLLAVTAAAWLLVDVSALDAWAARVTKILATVAGAASALVVPLRIAKKRVDGLSRVLERIRTEYEQQLAVEKKTNSKEADEVVRARRELESTEASVTAARARLAELLNQQATLDPRRRLGVFLEERVQSTQYRSQQGIISLVHKDFSELSKYMKDLRDTATTEGAPAPQKGAIRPFDRIVLYVDDLDRCRPAHVVNMLEAVHLLLALDLFVVVVAVDSRWLTRALEVYYQDLLTGADGDDGGGLRASTPQSYLEKIFQITYALGPMNPTHFSNYVAFLTGEEAEKKARSKAAASANAGAPQASSGSPSQSAATEQGGQTGQPQAAGAAQRQEGQSPDSASPKPTAAKVVRSGSPAVHIGKAEREFIGRLVPLLPTPRIAKRLVNVYRVIKAAKSVEELEAFERDGRARTCLLMLAILFGRPAIAGQLLRALHERKPPFETPDEPLVAALRKRVPTEGEPASIRKAWDTLIVTLETMGITETVGEAAREPKEVARYSLVSGHDWHTWSNPPADTVKAPGPLTVF